MCSESRSFIYSFCNSKNKIVIETQQLYNCIMPYGHITNVVIVHYEYDLCAYQYDQYISPVVYTKWYE